MENYKKAGGGDEENFFLNSKECRQCDLKNMQKRRTLTVCVMNTHSVEMHMRWAMF